MNAANLTDALAIDAGKLVTSSSVPGIRTSRSYNTLSEVAELDWGKKEGGGRSTTKEAGVYLAYGLSPRFH